VRLAAFLHRNPRGGVNRPDVLGAWADEAVVVQLLDDVGRPAGDAADGEDGRVEVDVNAQGRVGGSRVEIHIGVQFLVGVDVEFDGARHLKPLGFACIPAQLFAHAAQVGGAGIFGFVDAVPKAGNLLLGCQHAFDVIHRVGAGLVDGVEQAHDA